MPLTTTVSITVQAVNTKALDQRNAVDTVPFNINMTLADGTGAGKASKVFYDERTLADGATEDLDLSGSLTDGFGATVAFTKIRFIAIKSADANTTILSVGGDATAAVASLFGDVTDIVKVGPGGFILAGNPSLAGYAVTATTADILQIVNAAGAEATYRIMIVGE